MNKKELGDRDVARAAGLGARQVTFVERLSKGEVPIWLKEHFCDEHLDEALADLNLTADAAHELIALTWALHDQIDFENTNGNLKKPAEVEQELSALVRTARNMRNKIIAASDQVRFACILHESVILSDKEYEESFGPDPFDEIVPPLDDFIATLEQSEISSGNAGAPMNLKRHALAILANWFEEKTGRVSKRELTKLVEYFIEPALSPNDSTRWRDLIKSTLDAR